MTQDQALKQAGDIIIKAFPETFGSVTFNLQGTRKTVHANVTSKVAIEAGQCLVDVDMKQSKQL